MIYRKVSKNAVRFKVYERMKSRVVIAKICLTVLLCSERWPTVEIVPHLHSY